MFDLDKIRINRVETKRRIESMERARCIKITKENIREEFNKGECTNSYLTKAFNCSGVDCTDCRKHLLKKQDFFDSYFKESNIGVLK